MVTAAHALATAGRLPSDGSRTAIRRCAFTYGLVVCLLGVFSDSQPGRIARASSCSPLLTMPVSFVGNELCFSPGDAGAAERLVPEAPVRPRSTVFRFAHLRLQQEVVLQTETAAGGTPRAYAIHYVFGKIPRTANRTLDPSRLSPHFVLVSEIVGHMPAGGATVRRGLGVFVTFSINRASNRSAPWEFDANLPTRDLSLHVNSNISRRLVTLIGTTILKETSSQ